MMALDISHFFTFHISMFFSASFACGALMVSKGELFVVPRVGTVKVPLVKL